MESVMYVGMDVDSEKIAVSVLRGFEGRPRLERIVANTPKEIERFFKELLESGEVVQACYEASGFGFGLYRRLTEMGVCCMVVAPASLPKKATDRIKTDRPDARKLALALRRGELSPIYTPSREEDAVRDYLRLYEDVKLDLKKAKLRLLHFLHRQEIRYTEGSNWTGKFWQWLRTQQFSSPLLHETFQEYVAQVSELDEKRLRIQQRVGMPPPSPGVHSR